MLYIFTYYSSQVSHVFQRSMRALSAVSNFSNDTSLFVIAEETVPSKALAAVSPFFGDVTVIPPKFSVQAGETRDIASSSFLEVLMLYQDYDRLFIDPNIFLVSSFSLPVDSSLFFKQHAGMLSTKLAYLKAGPQFANAFSTILSRGDGKSINEQAFTYGVGNNFLIKKKLFEKPIVNGKLFESSGLPTFPTESVVAVDLSGVTGSESNSKTLSSVSKLESSQKPIVLTGIKKKKRTIVSTIEPVSLFSKPVKLKNQPTSPKTRDRSIIDRLLGRSPNPKRTAKVISDFSDPTKLTVIIPVYKNAPVLAVCLDSVLNSTSDNFNLLVINDSPFDEEVEQLGNAFRNTFYDHFTKSEYVFLTNSENLGFIKTVNRGLRMSKGDVILLNSDTIVSKGWEERLVKYKEIAKVASVTPFSNSASQCSFPIQERDQSHYNGLSPSNIDAVFSRVPMEASHEAPTGVGFCMLMSKEAIETIGYFDEVNFKMGYGEENDWCWRAVKAGFVNIIAPNVYVAHEHGTSFSEVSNLGEIRMKNKQALIAKYPNYFSIIQEYYNKRSLVNVYSLLKYALDFEYSRPLKKPVTLVLGEKELTSIKEAKTSEVSVKVSDLSLEVSANDFLVDQTTVFSRTATSLKTLLFLLDPTKVEVVDDDYLKIPEIADFLKDFEKSEKKADLVVEIQYYDNTLSGGISRMQRLVFELPRYANTSGGIRESLKFLDKFPSNFSVSARFQRLISATPPADENWTVGLPNSTFPECDACITYSDNPYLQDLVKLPQVKKVLLYMLSYGMAIERERKNVLTPGITVMCSTKKLEDAISKEGVKVHRVGFAIDQTGLYLDSSVERKNYLAILYHSSNDKRYSTAVSVANDLFARKKIDGVITFGSENGYSDAIKPAGLVKHYSNANRDQIREIFNTCKCFLMPSVSEGLNLTPVESTLCGCPAVICDGAIDELFYDGKTCFVVEKDSLVSMVNKTEEVFSNFEKYSKKFKEALLNILTDYTWEKVIKKIVELI